MLRNVIDTHKIHRLDNFWLVDMFPITYVKKDWRGYQL